MTWPKKLSNKKVYGLTKTKPWSQIIRIRRSKWFGLIIFEYYMKDIKKPRDRPHEIWVSTKEDLQNTEFDLGKRY